MEERIWDKNTTVGKIVFNWATFFGNFYTPDNVCTLLRNMLIGTPVVMFLFAALITGLAAFVVGTIMLPVFLIFGPEAVTYGMIMSSNAYNLDTCLAINQVSTAAECYVNTWYMLQGNAFWVRWGYDFAALGTICWGAMTGVGIIALLDYSKKGLSNSWRNNKIVKDIKEAHDDNICFKIKWK